MTNTEKVWARFIEIRGWEHFDPDLDNVGGADDITTQAASVVVRLADDLGEFLETCPESVVGDGDRSLRCFLPTEHSGRHKLKNGLEFQILPSMSS